MAVFRELSPSRLQPHLSHVQHETCLSRALATAYRAVGGLAFWQDWKANRNAYNAASSAARARSGETPGSDLRQNFFRPVEHRLALPRRVECGIRVGEASRGGRVPLVRQAVPPVEHRQIALPVRPTE